jgi:hypothetical protein
MTDVAPAPAALGAAAVAGRASSDHFRAMKRIFLAAALAASGAAAETPVTYVDDGRALFRFVAPDDWLLRTGFETDPAEMPEGETPAPRILTLEPRAPEGVMWVGLWSPPRLSDIEAPETARYVDGLGARFVAAARITGSRTESSPVPMRVYSGEGVVRGPQGRRHAVRFDLALAQLSGGRVAVMAFIGEPAMRAAHGAALATVLNSVEAVR